LNEAPSQLLPYLEVLGPDTAVDFLLAFGGSPVYLAAKPTLRSDVARLIGVDKARKLAREIGPGHVRVPLCKPWLAHRFRQGGMSVVAIARKLHVDATTVRRWFATDEEQLDLF